MIRSKVVDDTIPNNYNVDDLSVKNSKSHTKSLVHYFVFKKVKMLVMKTILLPTSLKEKKRRT